MLIEVNLLPAGARGARARGPGLDLGALGARLRGPFADRYLLGAGASVALACATVASLHTTQAREADALEVRQEVALADSSRYAAVIAVRRKAIAERDSVARQLAIITAIDSSRYTWAHVLAEVSESLPAYTWLTSVQQTSAPPAPPASASGDSAAAKPGAPAAPGGALGAAADTAKAAPRTLTFRLVGQTVDIQALTLFMRDLEASPFLQNVQLARSEAVLVDGKDVTEFTLDGEFQNAPRELLHTFTLAVPVR